ncbi:tRNA dihydrouridine synthase DusB [Carbonactinospora thermoautotrophica]|uniref:tRNA dihydrouridine synthase DusB n=1 Tax=Carbonactinospora thermoautotrophica TaxID=1469144 RepID=UPI000834543B|nr:tRNA dihydrouridine synthase DusB [Carbonactinospora thermoautotrophica]
MTVADTSAARPGEFRPLRVGPYQVWPPVVLAPMAGITNAPFRVLCREYGAGLYVSEMITSRALVERDEKTLSLIRFAPGEHPRSLQLYGVDPATVADAVKIVVGEGLADHVDLNFGCPVPKVTRRGGGAALPYKRNLLRDILRAAVRAAGDVPVTVKMRKGIDEDHLTYLDAGRIAQDEGVAAVALHGRTAAQMYDGRADWSAIARLKEALDIPVLGNGDIWQASDAIRMMRQTGCDGVVVGRGCLGRPWLFRDLAFAFAGRAETTAPRLGEVAATMRRHAELLAAWMGEVRAMRDFRKHVSWYLKGFVVGNDLRARMGMVSTLAELDALLGELDPDQPWPAAVAVQPRGRQTGSRRVHLPAGWLDSPEVEAPPTEAELAHSGG